MKDTTMFIFASARKLFVCEICEEPAIKPLTMGIESNCQVGLPVQLCPACGPIDLNLMQLCREATIRCSVN